MKYPDLKQFTLQTPLLPPLLCIPLCCFVLHTIIVYAAATLSGESLLLPPGGFINPLLSTDNPLVEKFLKWDAHWYTYVAQEGYNEISIVFFPMLLFLIERAAPLFNYDYGLAGFIICNAFSLASFILMYLVFQLDFSKTVSDRALLAYSVMPTSLYLNSIYTEPVFITFSLACIYCVRQRHWWSAGLFAAMTALTRNIGVFLMLLMLYELGEKLKWHFTLKQFRLSFLAVFLPPLAFLGYAAYNYRFFGDPLAFVNAQKAWGRTFSPPWVNIWQCGEKILQEPQIGLVLDFLLVLLTLCALLMLTFHKKYDIPKSYILIGWCWFLIPLCSTTPWMPLYSMSRFVLVIFPLYLWLAQLPRYAYLAYLGAGSIGLVVCIILFTNWYWIS